MKDAWEYLTKLPELLEAWGSYSWALLAALALVGAGLIVLFTRRGARVGRSRSSRAHWCCRWLRAAAS